MDNGQTPNGNRGETWNEDDDRKEKEISEILLTADDKGTNGQHAASEVGKLENGIPSIKISEPGITVDKNERKRRRNRSSSSRERHGLI